MTDQTTLETSGGDSEVWRDLPGYEGLYQISDQGRAKRLAYSVKRQFKEGGVVCAMPQRIFKPSGKYPQSGFTKDGVCTRAYIHHLVAKVFLGPRPPGYEVCHNDGNPANPSASNLRYDTSAGNSRDRFRHGTSRYSEEMIAQIKHDLLTERIVRVAKNWDVSHATARALKIGRMWSGIAPVPLEPFPNVYIDEDVLD